MHRLKNFSPDRLEGESYAQRDARVHLAAADAIVTEAKAAGGVLTAEQKASAEAHLDAARQARGQDAIAEQIDAMTGHGGKATTSGAVGLTPEAMNAFTTAVLQGTPAKATLTLAGAGVFADYRPDIVDVRREPFRVRDLFPRESTEAPAVWFRRISTGSAQADAVLEGGLKPESTIAATQVEAPVRKLAVWVPVTDEVLADGGPSFVSELVGDLSRDVIRKENQQILSGTGTAPELRGILSTTGLLTRAKGTDSVLDSLIKGFTQMRTTSYVEPDVVVLHPSAFEAVRLAKDTTNGYVLGSPLYSGQPSLLGATVHVTSDMPAATALIANSRELARVYLREEVSVAYGLTADGFVRNITALRAETRLALAVRRPAAGLTVTGL